jgi:outer membrane protein TolC
MIRLPIALVFLFLLASPAAAQAPRPPDVFLHGVPADATPAGRRTLSLAEAVRMGLDHNLAAILEQQRVRSADGSRLEALADLLPRVSAGVRQSTQVVNLAAFGFTGFPGIPQLVGPFGVFDARVAASAPLFDASAIGDFREQRANLRAERATLGQTRDTVVLVVGNLYLEAVADVARVASAQAEVATADALVRLAEDQKASGLVAGIDVLRQQVELASARARLIGATNALEKQKLLLARAIGLPAGQAFDLSDRLVYSPAPALTLDAAVAEAAGARDDLRAAEARAEAARAARQSARGEALPTVAVDADYGAIGSSASTTARTYSVTAAVRVPLFEGGKARARVLEADADVRAREAELADLNAGVRYEVQAALLDLGATDATVKVAESARGLTRDQLTQAEDRFRAGVANTIELVQAQQSVADAEERYTASLFAHSLAKAALARALGQVEQRFPQLVGGRE